VPRWATTVRKALPNCDKLSPDCFGALVSLAYNRGASFSLAGERYAEMRAIKAHMAAGEFSKIPGEFRSMKRLWMTPSVRGVAARRDHEALLFQKGLADPVKIGPASTASAAPITPPAGQVIPNAPPAAKSSATTAAAAGGGGAAVAGTVVTGLHQGWPASYWLIAAGVGLMIFAVAYLIFKKKA
jgi:hypothetical protein